MGEHLESRSCTRGLIEIHAEYTAYIGMIRLHRDVIGLRFRVSAK